MSTCGGCKGSCPSQKPDCCSTPTAGKSHAPREKKSELTSYLKSSPKNEGDKTPLTYPCECCSFIRAPRYQCMNCLRSWAIASTDDEIEAQIIELREKRSRIAADRLERIFAEIKNTRRL